MGNTVKVLLKRQKALKAWLRNIQDSRHPADVKQAKELRAQITEIGARLSRMAWNE